LSSKNIFIFYVYRTGNDNCSKTTPTGNVCIGKFGPTRTKRLLTEYLQQDIYGQKRNLSGPCAIPRFDIALDTCSKYDRESEAVDIRTENSSWLVTYATDESTTNMRLHAHYLFINNFDLATDTSRQKA
jgi:hypothetical protein